MIAAPDRAPQATEVRHRSPLKTEAAEVSGLKLRNR